jgi:hypothetical protein
MELFLINLLNRKESSPVLTHHNIKAWVYMGYGVLHAPSTSSFGKSVSELIRYRVGGPTATTNVLSREIKYLGLSENPTSALPTKFHLNIKYNMESVPNVNIGYKILSNTNKIYIYI